MSNTELHETAAALVAEGKGILAADESSGTIKKRFDSIGVESTEENRRAYRNLLVTTPGAEEYISGVILFDETIRQSADDGTPFPELLASKGVIPGIKVDQGAKPLAHADGETVTEGLDGLRQRLEDYRGAGDRLPFRRPIGRGRDRAPQRDERARPAPVAAVLLLRARAAGAGAEGMGRQAGERRGRPARVLPPRKDERGGAYRHVRP